MPSPSEVRIGMRIAMTVLWAIVMVSGVSVGVLLAVPGIGAAIQGSLTSNLAASTIGSALAVGMVLVGLWGITSSYRSLRHTLDLMAEADRARKESIQLEGTRYLEHPK